jgi:hypothetical protein
MVAQIEVGIAAIAGLERLPLLEVGERDPSEIAAAVTQFLAAAHDRLAFGNRVEAKAPSGTFAIDVTQHDRPVVLIGGN